MGQKAAKYCAAAADIMTGLIDENAAYQEELIQLVQDAVPTAAHAQQLLDDMQGKRFGSRCVASPSLYRSIAHSPHSIDCASHLAVRFNPQVAAANTFKLSSAEVQRCLLEAAQTVLEEWWERR